jgi:hypothetical protein
MLRNRAIFVLIALVILPGRASLAEVFSADKRNNPLAGLVYSNEKLVAARQAMLPFQKQRQKSN